MLKLLPGIVPKYQVIEKACRFAEICNKRAITASGTRVEFNHFWPQHPAAQTHGITSKASVFGPCSNLVKLLFTLSLLGSALRAIPEAPQHANIRQQDASEKKLQTNRVCE